MKIRNIYIIGAALAMLTACNTRLVPSVDQADNAIVLRAGISEGPAGVQTKAVDDGHAGTASGGAHKALSQGTKLSLRVDGKWLGKGFTNNLVSKTTTATVGGETSTDSKHNNLSLSPQLYWDDYGSADPANIDAPKGTASASTGGRGIGLTIYGAAVNDGGSTDVVINGTSGKQWDALTWELPADQKGGWSTNDLLTSNNVRSGGDGTYKFDDYIHDLTESPKQSSNLLEFTHAMSMVTVVLTAKEGFEGYSTETPDNGVFTGNPEVTLKNFKYTGTVDIIGKISTPTDAVSDISMYNSAGGASSHTAIFTALVYPGNEFDDAAEILTFTADGNTFKVKAKQLNDAIQTAITNKSTTGYPDVHDEKFQQGWNYKINITVNKTSIDVTATIKDWEVVSTAQETPIIGFSSCYGQPTGSSGLSEFAKDFSFFRSTNVNGSYILAGNSAEVTYADSKYTMTPQLFWPNHSTHYFFRGIWPVVNNDSGHTLTGKVVADGILVDNSVYSADTYPTDLMIGMPRNADGTPDETCKVDAHKTGDPATAPSGICATDAVDASHPNEGLIHMNFQYAMSQVIVKLTTNEAVGAKDKVTFDEHTSVEIIDCYSEGKIKLSDGTSDFTGRHVGNYVMAKDNAIPSPVANNHANYRNVIIPQNLTNTIDAVTKDLKFRITVGDGTTTDVYETVLGIKNIKVNTDQTITAWEPGKRYIYTLYITKTDIKVSATLKDWIDVSAEEDIWF